MRRYVSTCVEDVQKKVKALKDVSLLDNENKIRFVLFLRKIGFYKKKLTERGKRDCYLRFREEFWTSKNTFEKSKPILGIKVHKAYMDSLTPYDAYSYYISLPEVVREKIEVKNLMAMFN